MTRDARLPILTIDGGVHESAAVPVPVGEISVGSGPSDAVVVSDLPVPAAFRLAWDGRSLRLRAVGCDVAADGKMLRRGRERALKRASCLAAGGVAFRLELPSAADAARVGRPGHRPSRAVLRGPRGFAAGIVVAATAALVAAPTWPPDPPGGAAAAAVSKAVADVPARPVRERPVRDRPTRDAGTLLGELRAQLAAAGLDGIAVEIQPDGAIAASGRVAPANGEAWRAVGRWFDTAAEGRAVLIDRVDVSAAVAALQVRAVYTGHTPYVIDGDGQKLFVGSSLPDGSVVQKVESRRVLLRRGDRVMAVRF